MNLSSCRTRARFLILAAATLPIVSQAGLTPAQISAVTAAANKCPSLRSGATLGPSSFYWEVGDGSGFLAGSTVGPNPPDQYDTSFPLASGTKLIFASYVAANEGPAMNEEARRHLRMYAGYTNPSMCIGPNNGKYMVTVDICFGQSGGKDGIDQKNVDHFYYSGNQLQAYAASRDELKNLNALDLATKIIEKVGGTDRLNFRVPLLGGGGQMAPVDYGVFLSRMVRKDADVPLAMKAALGTYAVCTDDTDHKCPTLGDPGLVGVASPPLPDNQVWQYSLGHFVEKDPNSGAGDGAFSSPGEFGFYPWIDSSKTYYGIVARAVYTPVAYKASILCGQSIRKALLDSLK